MKTALTAVVVVVALAVLWVVGSSGETSDSNGTYIQELPTDAP